MMRTNDRLIAHFFQNSEQHFNKNSVDFVFDTLHNLASNKDITSSYRFSDGTYTRRPVKNAYDIAFTAERLKSLSGLSYSFILEGPGQPFKQNNVKPMHNEFADDFYGDNRQRSFGREYSYSQSIGEESSATLKFLSKSRDLLRQLNSVVHYMISYYTYSLSIDYSHLLKQWENAVPTLHLMCGKEIKALESIISSTYEANTFFKSRYEKFVEFLIKSGPFVEAFTDNSGMRKMVDDCYNDTHSFFGHSGMNNRKPTLPRLNDKIKDIFVQQEKILTDFIDSNKDILVSNEADGMFNQEHLVADYNRVLKICEIMIEKTNIHKNFDCVNAVSFLNNHAERHDEIMQTPDLSTYTHCRDLNIVATIKDIKHSNITDAIVFNDKSVAVKKKGYEGFQYSPSSFVGGDLILMGYMAEINYMLRKNPSVNKSVKVLMNNLKTKYTQNQSMLFNSLKGLRIALKSYFDNENIVKAHNFDLIAELKSSRSFEEFDDKIHKVVRKHKLEQYAMSIVSNKYKGLYSDKTFEIMTELYDMGISTHILQDMIGKKMAGIKNTRSLNAALKSLLNSINGFEIANIKMKAAANQVQVLFETDNYLVLEIDTFKQSKAMGSPSWCISRDDYHFTNYTEGGNIQVFVYDFSLTSKDNKSMVGITLTKNMKVHAAHNKNDSELRDKEIKEKVIKIVADAKGFKLPEPKSKAPKAA